MEKFAIISCCLHLQRYHRVSLCLEFFSLDSFLSFILCSSVCMYIHNTKNFQQKKFQKNCLFQQIRAMCVCVCMRVRMAAAALTQFFSDFFP